MSAKILLIAGFLLSASSSAASSAKKPDRVAVLWHDPGNIASLDLYYGPGGQDGIPQAPFVFVKEDMKGTNPKFDVRDHNGVKWKVKLGVEAGPEVVAARLVWAVGFFVQENYLVPKLEVQNMPQRLRRGQELIQPDGSIYGARLKRIPADLHKINTWRWRKNPFTGSRELNGLRVVMALINNLDMKDMNNAVYRERRPKGSAGASDVYMVSDLGASFSERVWPIELKGNLRSYKRIGFIRKIGPLTVDFNMPTGPAIVDLAHLTWYVGRIWMRWLAKDIPIADAKWMGQKLGQLSREQVQDAFRAGGYSNEDIQGFTEELLQRIAALNGL